MLKLGAHNHLLWRLYRFIDADLEEQYEKKYAQWSLYSARLHFYVSFVIAIEYLLPFIKGYTLDWLLPMICTFAALALLSATLALCSHFSASMQRNILPVHTVFCCTLACVYAYTLRQQGMNWTAHLSSVVLLDGHEEFDASGPLGIILAHISSSCSAYLILLNSAVCQGVPLALLGLKRWTLFMYLFVLFSLVGALFITMPERVNAVALSTASAFCLFCFLCISIVMERSRRASFLAEVLLTRELRASQMADSILNHTLKNTLADVAANLEVYLAGDASDKLLEDCISCLRRGMRSCKERLAYLRLVAGDYAPSLHAVRLTEFGQQLIAGRPMTGMFTDLCVYLDSTLCNLILENAISNALKHGHPENPDVQFLVSASDEDMPPGRRRLRFSIKNAANPDLPMLTEAAVQELFEGNPQLQQKSAVPVLSDRIGLSHCMMAAKAGGMQVALRQEDGVVTFDLFVFTEDAAATPQHRTTAPTPPIQDFPSGLRFVCIDDSMPSSRLLEFHIRKWCSPAAVHSFGQHEADIELFLSAAVSEADIIITDQYLEYSQTYLGTDLVVRLRDLGYRGLVCIRSGNDTPDDRELYSRCGAHCAFGKDMLGSKMMEELKATYLANMAARRSGCIEAPRTPPPQPVGGDDVPSPCPPWAVPPGVLIELPVPTLHGGGASAMELQEPTWLGGMGLLI